MGQNRGDRIGGRVLSIEEVRHELDATDITSSLLGVWIRARAAGAE